MLISCHDRRDSRVPRIGYAPRLGGVAPLLTPDEHFLLGWRPRRGIVASRLSGGTRQKLNVVLAELDGPDLILLDESYQGFDEDSCLIFRSQLLRWRDRGAGILMITHMLHDLDDIDHVIELHPGEDL